MTSTLCQSAALGRFIAPWAAMIAEILVAIMETLLTIVRNDRIWLHASGGRAAARSVAPGALSFDGGDERDHGAAMPGTLSVRCKLLADIGVTTGVDRRQFAEPEAYVGSVRQKCLHVNFERDAQTIPSRRLPSGP